MGYKQSTPVILIKKICAKEYAYNECNGEIINLYSKTKGCKTKTAILTAKLTDERLEKTLAHTVQSPRRF